MLSRKNSFVIWEIPTRNLRKCMELWKVKKATFYYRSFDVKAAPCTVGTI
ncbi:hypothetical protein V3C99_009887 [Haemonchus contortus]